MPPIAPGARAACVAALGWLLTGCAQLPQDDGWLTAQQHARQTLQAELPPPAASAPSTLPSTLDEPAAVQLSLQRHAGLRAALARLQAEAAQGALDASLPAPGFSLSVARQGELRETEWGWHVLLSRLLSLPKAREREAQRLEMRRWQAAASVQQQALQVRLAWLDAVAARQTLGLQAAAQDAAAVSAELAERLARAGNFSALQSQRVQAMAAQTQADSLLAQQAADGAMLRLLGLLGLGPAELPWLRQHLPQALAPLPPHAPEPPRDPATLHAALPDRLELRTLAAQSAAEQAAPANWLPEASLGQLRNHSNDGPPTRTWELELALPGWMAQARASRQAATQLSQSLSLQQAEQDALINLYQVDQERLQSWQQARHATHTRLPLAQAIATEQGLRYNGMLIGVLELLESAQARLQAQREAVSAQHRFWRAQAQWEAARYIPTQTQSEAAGTTASSSAANAPSAAGH